MKLYTTPHLIHLDKIGNDEIGYLSIANYQDQIPFLVKRVFITSDTPKEVIRGRHAHHQTEMILIAVKGTIRVMLEDTNNKKYDFVLSNKNEGLFIPKLYWHTMEYEENCMQLVLCSTNYDENDYIRDYDEFRKTID